ncbi:phosphate/phosphite/phosphonate ABC transporter substrate-binding protein [Shimia aestuarii]|uniref:ABC-type phosphate/phosphonate transport system, substrate-binding protein n=1 Tax=Shimia aestuarii TaxID=254406 RepID=A0A1I4QJV9_9RHOB|nr:PhnD/SsuA/transferrin family substrate-binding protein [Shimia aestuarii]SFM40341.1 ABC-type phosphate/phosphonate transport system, substrate-binding protein [Shimia aestuarii]
MIASLAMYDRPETAAANDRLWRAVRDHLGHGPDTLTRDADLWQVWQSPDLLLAQTCGFPFRARLHDQVTLVATPDYGLPGCPPGYYNSVLVTNVDHPATSLADFDGARLAYNEALSQSGWAAPHAYFAAHDLRIGPRVVTGAHRDSARAVAENRADIAALDALTWHYIQQFDPFAHLLREIDHTAPTPALPFITARAQDPAPLRNALKAAISDLAPADRALLSLRDVLVIPEAAYLAVPTPPAP